MTVFQRKPFNSKPPSKLNQMVLKNPLIFGIPFCLLMVGASFALTPFTQTRYDLQDQKLQAVSTLPKLLIVVHYDSSQVTKEQEMGLDRKNRKKFDIREEYYVSSPCSTIARH